MITKQEIEIEIENLLETPLSININKNIDAKTIPAPVIDTLLCKLLDLIFAKIKFLLAINLYKRFKNKPIIETNIILAISIVINHYVYISFH